MILALPMVVIADCRVKTHQNRAVALLIWKLRVLEMEFSDRQGGGEAKHSFSPELSTFAAVLQESIQVCLMNIQGKIDKDEKIDYEE